MKKFPDFPVFARYLYKVVFLWPPTYAHAHRCANTYRHTHAHLLARTHANMPLIGSWQKPDYKRQVGGFGKLDQTMPETPRFAGPWDILQVQLSVQTNQLSASSIKMLTGGFERTQEGNLLACLRLLCVAYRSRTFGRSACRPSVSAFVHYI